MAAKHDLSDLTTHCIRCGFCLEACPTFRTLGSEIDSPRGRIYLVRSALEGKLRWQEDVKLHIDRCLGCLACQTACPSGVEYGAILELARDKLEREHANIPRTALLKSTTTPAILKAQLALGKLVPGNKLPNLLSKFISGQNSEVELPQAQELAELPPLNESKLRPLKGEVYMLEGCAMRVLFPRVHQVTRRLLRRAGYTVKETAQGCCGAMHAHYGHLDDAHAMLADLARSMPDDLPIVINSAGCGSLMKAAGGELFGKRPKDISEFLLEAGLIEELSRAPGLDARVTYHDACHLAHGQRITQQPRELIRAIPHVQYVELPEADTCCGSAGIYNVMQPSLGRQLLDRKYGNIESTKATVVATGNPGCHAWIAQAAREHGRSIQVLHTAELLEAAFSGLQNF